MLLSDDRIGQISFWGSNTREVFRPRSSQARSIVFERGGGGGRGTDSSKKSSKKKELPRIMKILIRRVGEGRSLVYL